MTEAPFSDLRRRGKTYPRGTVTVIAGVTRFEAESGGRLRWPRRGKPATILEPITPSTPIVSEPPNLTIGESTFTVADAETYGRLLEAAYEPREEERRRRRVAVGEAASKVSLFLAARGEALVRLAEFASATRRTLAESSNAPATDPVAAYVEGLSAGLSDAYGSAESAVSGVEGDLGEGGARRLYAAVYAVGRAQDAAFSGDAAPFADAVTLAGRAVGRALQGDRLRHLAVPRLTETLCAELEEAALRMFDEAGASQAK